MTGPSPSVGRPVAIVTGGLRGIGYAVADALAADGNDVAIVDIPPDREAERARAGIADNGVRVFYRQADIADVSAHAAIVADIVAALGRVDLLVNNAGIGAPERGDPLDLKPENFDRVLAVNLRGAVFFTIAVVRAMLLAGPGDHARAIVNVTSVSAALASPERLDYCVSKAGLAMWSAGLALRLAREGIAVFDVRPGIVRTGLTRPVAEAYDRRIADGLVPAGRWGEPADIGAVVASLVRGPFAFATGSVINADGGLAIARL